MKYAIVEGKKAEATKRAKGVCQFCASELIAKCGETKSHHWAHKSIRGCDSWWETEGEWHRSWKNEFPSEWQEIIHIASTGERHIADVKTETGWVIEFQSSYLKPEERRSRNEFYDKLIWVVDGCRRPTDVKQFNRILEEGSTRIVNKPYTIRVNFPDECRLINEWGSSDKLVFFDFYSGNKTGQEFLWFLYPQLPSGNVYISRIKSCAFVETSNGNGFEKLFQEVIFPMHQEILPLYEQHRRHR